MERMGITAISKNSLVVVIVIIIVTFSLLYLRIETSDKKDKEFQTLLLEDRQTQQLQNYTLNEIAESSITNNKILQILDTRFSQEFLNKTLQNFEEQSDSNETAYRILEELRELRNNQ